MTGLDYASSLLPYYTGAAFGGGPAVDQQLQASDRADAFFSAAKPAGFWDKPAQTNYTSTVGMAVQATGALMGAIGAYASAISQKEQLKSQALSLEFQQAMSQLNARQAEEDAQAIMAAGRTEVGRLTMQRGQETSRRKVSAAARGVVATQGSAAEGIATNEILKEIDVMTINRNTVRAAGQARTQATNARNQSLLAGVSAGNLRSTASSIKPYAAFHASAGNSASNFLGNFNQGRRN